MKKAPFMSMTGKEMPGYEAGFSLIELLIVVSIIGVLVAIAAASYAFVITRSKETACTANRRVLETAIHAYLADEGLCPQDLDDLFPQYIDNHDTFHCPLSGVPYNYTTNAGRTSYTLTCPSCEE